MTLLPGLEEHAEDTAAFDKFWDAYPTYRSRKGSKSQCKKKWKRLKLDGKIDKILDVLDSFKKDWAESGNKYMPGAHKWLNSGSYDCDIADIDQTKAEKRSRKCPDIAKGIAKKSDVTYGPDGARAFEMMRADSGFERRQKMLQVQKEKGASKMTVFKAYLILAERERNA